MLSTTLTGRWQPYAQEFDALLSRRAIALEMLNESASDAFMALTRDVIMEQVAKALEQLVPKPSLDTDEQFVEYLQSVQNAAGELYQCVNQQYFRESDPYVSKLLLCFMNVLDEVVANAFHDACTPEPDDAGGLVKCNAR
jgi:hypothetical protein